MADPTPAAGGGPIIPPDWSQFIPDTLSGLFVSAVVGLVVGILLWRWQQRAEQRAARLAAESGWNVARALVGQYLSMDMIRDDDWWLGNYAGQTDDLVDAAHQFPIGQWADASPGNLELAAMRRLLIDAPTLRRLASELDNWLESEAVSRGYTRRENANSIARMATPRILGTTPTFSLGAKWETNVETLLRDPTAERLVAEFLEVAQRVEADHAVMRQFLKGPERAT
jgi:hypothetical protein